MRHTAVGLMLAVRRVMREGRMVLAVHMGWKGLHMDWVPAVNMDYRLAAQVHRRSLADTARADLVAEDIVADSFCVAIHV